MNERVFAVLERKMRLILCSSKDSKKKVNGRSKFLRSIVALKKLKGKREVKD